MGKTLSERSNLFRFERFLTSEDQTYSGNPFRLRSNPSEKREMEVNDSRKEKTCVDRKWGLEKDPPRFPEAFEFS